RARVVLATQSCTIPRAGLVRVLCGGRFVGEIEEAFAAALQSGDVFQLGGEAWRTRAKDGLRLHVAPARGEPPTVPAWRSEGLAITSAVAGEARKLMEAGGVPETPESATP